MTGNGKGSAVAAWVVLVFLATDAPRTGAHTAEGVLGLFVSWTRRVGIRDADRTHMTDGERLLKLIEEMVELKVELHASLPTGTKPELVQMVTRKRHEDRHRLNAVREQIVQLFNG